MQPITSTQSKRFKDAVQLHRSRGRKRQNRMIVFGERSIERALLSGIEIDELFVRAGEGQTLAVQSIVSQSADGIDEADLARRCFVLPDAMFETLSYGDRADGVIMTAKRPETSLDGLEQLISTRQGRAGQSGDSLIVVCEQIEKPGNLGGILRSADGSGASAVIVADALTDPFHPNSIRNSVGAAFSVPTALGTSALILEWLAAHDYRVLIATPEATDAYFDKNLRGRVAIVLGNEARGVSQIFKTGAVDPFRLPMLGVADSLNVSVTGAVLMYEAMRQRNSSR